MRDLASNIPTRMLVEWSRGAEKENNITVIRKISKSLKEIDIIFKKKWWKTQNRENAHYIDFSYRLKVLFFGVYTDAAPIPFFQFSQQLFFDVRNPYYSRVGWMAKIYMLLWDFWTFTNQPVGILEVMNLLF